MDEKPKPTPKPQKKTVNDSLTFITCPIHKVPYPKGGSCPMCH